MTRFATSSWQLILADLALILFLVTLSALAHEAQIKQQVNAQNPQVAPSQALFRPSPDGPSLREWLAQKPYDDRATLTVFVQHSGADQDTKWAQAHQLARDAADEGFAVRVVITRGASSDLHASLAYDAPE